MFDDPVVMGFLIPLTLYGFVHVFCHRRKQQLIIRKTQNIRGIFRYADGYYDFT